MHQDQNLSATHCAPDFEWSLTQPGGPAVERAAPSRRPVPATGPWLAAAPMLAVLGLTIGAALIVSATAKATAMLSPPRAIQIAGAEQMRRQALAVQAFQARDYAMAYGRFAALADAGDAPSALMALAMLRHGPAMFGSDWSITPGQVQRWSSIALTDVRDHGLAIAQHDRGE